MGACILRRILCSKVVRLLRLTLANSRLAKKQNQTKKQNKKDFPHMLIIAHKYHTVLLSLQRFKSLNNFRICYHLRLHNVFRATFVSFFFFFAQTKVCWKSNISPKNERNIFSRGFYMKVNKPKGDKIITGPLLLDEHFSRKASSAMQFRFAAHPLS